MPSAVLQAAQGKPNPAEADAWVKVARLAREAKVPVVTGSKAPSGQAQQPGGARRDRGDRDSKRGPAGPIDGRISVAEATLKDKEPVSVEELFANAPDRAGGKGLWLALDSLQDPHNVGAIFRAASFFGVQGILMTQERSAPLTGTAYDVSSGGIEYVPYTSQVNLQRAFEVAKEAGLWILGTSEHAKQDFKTITADRPWLLVLGNEEKGMRRLTEESCDVLCKIPAKGGVTSLNVSVAAGIFISKLTSPV